MQRRISIILLSVACLSLLLAGCGPKSRTAAIPRPEGKLAVAGFTNPIYNWQILAGYLEEEGNPVPDGTLEALDSVLIDTLQKHQVFDYITPLALKQCEDVVVFEEEACPRSRHGNTGSALPSARRPICCSCRRLPTGVNVSAALPV